MNIEGIIRAGIDVVLQFRAWVGSWLEPALPFLHSLAIVVSAVVLWGIFYAVAGSGYLTRRMEDLQDKLGLGDVGKARQMRAWQRIMKRLRSTSPTSWKQAILEADHIFDEVLKMSGYYGADVHERFAKLPPEALSHRDRLLAAHKVRDRIRQEPDFALSREDAVAVLKEYEHAFRELGLIG